jgi:hypothetical protein
VKPDAYIFWIFLAGFGVILYVGYLMDKKRREAMMRVARLLGLSYSPGADNALLSRFSLFQLGTRGHSQSMRNVLQGNYQGLEISFFDYSYTTGSGKHRHTTCQSVAFLPQADSGVLPDFTLRPENMFDKVATAFGCVDINFPQDEAFSRAYRLHGRDQAAVSGLFDEAVRGFLVRNPQLWVERAAPGLIVYRSGVRLEPETLRVFLDRSLELFSLLAAHR